MNFRQKLFYAIAGFIIGISAFSGASYFTGNQPAAERELSFEQSRLRTSGINSVTGAGLIDIQRTASAPISFHIFRILFILFIISPPLIVVLLLVIISKMDRRDSIK